MLTRISESLMKLLGRALTGASAFALLLVAAFTSAVPAQAQSGDTWKSVAIIGGSTAAGAYIGHKVGGTSGAYVGAAVGATAGYAIDRRRRQNQYNQYGYGNGVPYGDNGGYYGNNDPYYGNGGYYGNGPNGYPAPYGYQSNYRRR
ncbi:MAG: hypothetical protein ACXVZV_15060 [Terriglobales bacterium]